MTTGHSSATPRRDRVPMLYKSGPSLWATAVEEVWKCATGRHFALCDGVHGIGSVALITCWRQKTCMAPNKALGYEGEFPTAGFDDRATFDTARG